MTPPLPKSRRAFTLIEVLLALFVFTFGLLGLLGVMAGLLQSVSVIDEKHQTADLSALVQEAIRYDSNASPKKALTFDEIYRSLMDKPLVYLAYTVQTDPTRVDKRETKIVPNNTGITQTDLDNLAGPISKIFVQPSVSYRSLSVPSSTGTVTKVTSWVKDPTQSPDPFVSLDVFVYVMPRPSLPSEMDTSERHPGNQRPARRFTITLTR